MKNIFCHFHRAPVSFQNKYNKLYLFLNASFFAIALATREQDH